MILYQNHSKSKTRLSSLHRKTVKPSLIVRKLRRKQKNNTKKRNRETQKRVRKNRFAQAKSTHRQCKAELKSSEVRQAKISPFSLPGRACRRKHCILSELLGKKGTLQSYRSLLKSLLTDVSGLCP